ncbi:MAG: ABC transporter substrate-binding protein [Pseudomonadota bacterium]
MQRFSSTVFPWLRAASAACACLLAAASLGLAPARATDLIIVFPANIPPWTIEREDRGIALDIMREALKPFGYTVIPSYYPLARFTSAMHSHKNVDGVAMVEGAKIKEKYYFYSEPTGTFDTRLISLKKDKFKLRKTEDLYPLSLVAFEDANRVFASVDKIKHNNARYTESPNQASQVATLFLGRTNMILIDHAIFMYWKHELDINNPRSGLHDTPRIDVSDELEYHDVDKILGIHPNSPMQTLFRSAEVRDKFNEGLHRLKQSGQFEKIMAKYTAPLTP